MKEPTKTNTPKAQPELPMGGPISMRKRFKAQDEILNCITSNLNTDDPAIAQQLYRIGKLFGE